MAFTPAKCRDSWVALFSLTVARRRVCVFCSPHVRKEQNLARECGERRGEEVWAM